MKPTRSRTVLALLLLLPAAAGCSSWKQVQRSEDWTLYAQRKDPVETGAYQRSLAAAHAAVEAELGPFQRRVRVHAWNGGVEMRSGNEAEIRHGGEGLHKSVPGIGPTRVRAFHTSSPGSLFGSTGVYVGTPDCGTAVHELVHARLAEEERPVPLWFEEGFATLLGDGVLHEGRWVIDGFAAWPWRELRYKTPDDEELRRILSIRPEDPHSVRENVLLHFVGWAIVFDLHRELGVRDWRAMLARFRRAPDPFAEARRRMARTLSPETPLEWLAARLAEPAPQRLAAVKGTWKLHSPDVVERLLAQLEHEEDADVRAGLAVNVLTTAGHSNMSPGLQERIWRRIFPVLRDVAVRDPRERQALRALYGAYHYADASSAKQAAQAVLHELARYWEE